MGISEQTDEVVAMAEYVGIDPAEARSECERFLEIQEQFKASPVQPVASYSPLWNQIKTARK